MQSRQFYFLCKTGTFPPLKLKNPISCHSSCSGLKMGLKYSNGNKHYSFATNIKDTMTSMYQNFALRAGFDPRLPPEKRKHIVVLGSGWAAFKFLSKINIKYFDVTIVSPSSTFSFTPLLPSVCGGLLSPRSCSEPLRSKLLLRGGKSLMTLHEAYAEDADVENNILTCILKENRKFDIRYDYLILAVGSQCNTFNIPGVREHGIFLKNIEDAIRIRKKVYNLFKKASSHNTSEEEKERLLHFVIAGGGPTGVETAAEIMDFINHDAFRYFGDCARYAQVTLVEMQPKVLASFSQKASLFALKTLKEANVNVLLSTRVTKVDSSSITIESGTTVKTLPCNFVLWASGVAPVSFTQELIKKYDLKKNRGLEVNERLCVNGLPSNVFALGDCSILMPRKLASSADSFIKKIEHKNNLSYGSWLVENATKLSLDFPQLANKVHFLRKNNSANMKREGFVNLLQTLDTSFKPPPPTAQNAVQQSFYLVNMFNRYLAKNSSIEMSPAYLYNWRGSMAYVGNGKAIIENSFLGTVHGGHFIHFFWRFFYWTKLPSNSNRFLCIFDWLRAWVRGRQHDGVV